MSEPVLKARLRVVAAVVSGIGALLIGLGLHLSVYTGRIQAPLFLGAAVCVAVSILLYAFFQVEIE